MHRLFISGSFVINITRMLALLMLAGGASAALLRGESVATEFRCDSSPPLMCERNMRARAHALVDAAMRAPHTDLLSRWDGYRLRKDGLQLKEHALTP